MLSEKPWKPEAVLRLGLAILCCIFIGGIFMALVDKFQSKTTVESIWPQIVAILIGEGGVVILVGIFLRKHQLRWANAFGLKNHLKRALAFGILAAMLFLPVGWALQICSIKLMERVQMEPAKQKAVETLADAAGWLDHAALAIVMVVLAPLAEETLFRGILYPTIKQAGYPRLALWGVSLLFATVHFNVAAFVPLLVLALLLTWLYERTNNLLATITAHGLFNAANLALFYLLPWLEKRSAPHGPY